MRLYNVALCINDSYVQHCVVTIVSLAENNKSANFDIYILYNSISPENMINIEKIANCYKNINIILKLIDTKIVSGIKHIPGLVHESHIGESGYYRYLLPDVIPEQVDKILYLDSDLLVLGDIRPLFDIVLIGFGVAAIEENCGVHEKLQLSKNSPYFNSGVLLINLDMWRKEQIPHKALEFIYQNPAMITLGDQCGLNKVLESKWLILPPCYNVVSALWDNKYKSQYYPYTQLLEAKNLPIILHYTGAQKPWHFECRHQLRHLYWLYLDITPYRDFKYSKKGILRYVIKKIIYLLVPNKVIKLIRNK